MSNPFQKPIMQIFPPAAFLFQSGSTVSIDVGAFQISARIFGCSNERCHDGSVRASLDVLIDQVTPIPAVPKSDEDNPAVRFVNAFIKTARSEERKFLVGSGSIELPEVGLITKLFESTSDERYGTYYFRDCPHYGVGFCKNCARLLSEEGRRLSCLNCASFDYVCMLDLSGRPVR